MYASQIHRILNKEVPRQFVGVFAADQLPDVKGETALVVNTDAQDQEGSHWLAIYIQDENNLEFFDSYGLSPSTYEPHISSYTSRFPNIKWNQTRFQSLTSNVCGQYCMFYLLKRCRGFSMENILYDLSRHHMYNDMRMYLYFKKRYGVNMIFRK